MKEQETKPPVALEVYRILKEKIIRLELMPNQLLLVQQLSKDLNFSRTPVREAIVRLCDDGMVEETEGRKFRVTNINQKQIDDIYETRTVLEGMAISEVARRITSAQIQVLSHMIGRMEQYLDNQDCEKYFEVDFRFHHYILELHNNQVMLNCLDRIKDHQQRIRYLTISIYRRMEDSIAEHKRIVEYMKARDSEGARAMLKLHLDNAKQEIHQLLTSNFPKAMIMK